MQVYIDGKFFPTSKANISVYDHGFLYGDGVFEGIRIYNGNIFMLDEHINRLYDSAKAIKLKVPLSKAELRNAVRQAHKVNGLKDGYVRLIVTRGIGDLGIDPRTCLKSSIVIIVNKIALYPRELYRKGMEIITASTQRTPVSALNPQIKSMNYLNNILAKIEAVNAGANEALMLNSSGNVVECSGDNIFIYRNDTLITPPTSIGALDGITRGIVIKLAEQESLKVKELIFSRYEVYTSDECFLSGTAAEIIPVIKLDGREIGNGKPGKITALLINKFKKFTG
ncbi:MAG: branched-chain-amino-acid transaminase [bacterium]|nr:branched-chain-amino-acid transaminase [bacterium]